MNFKEKDNRLRLSEAIESGLKYGNAVVTLITDKEISLSAKFTCPHDGFSFPEIEPRLFSFNSPYGACPECHGLGTKDLWSEEICPVCDGQALRAESLNVLIDDKNINTVTALSIEDAHAFFSGLKFKVSSLDEVAEAPLARDQKPLKIHDGRRFGISDTRPQSRNAFRRRGASASAWHRRSAHAWWARSIYWTSRRSACISATMRSSSRRLQDLRDLGNTIILVEHDEDTIRASDYLVDIGPGAGVHGGKVVAEGPIPAILKDPKQNSLTLQYLRGKKFIEVPEVRRKVDDKQEHLKVARRTREQSKKYRCGYSVAALHRGDRRFRQWQIRAWCMTCCTKRLRTS